MLSLTLAITTYNRFDLTINSFEQVLDDPRINEILIMDDASTDDSFSKLRGWQVANPHAPIKLMAQVANRGMSLNKYDAIVLSKNDWVIIFDSDNVITPAYLDALEKVPDLFINWYEIYMPSWAQPNFDYRSFEGYSVRADNINEYLDRPMFEQCLNTCNMVVNKHKYAEVYQHNPEIKECDTLWMNYLWLKAGGSFYIVPDMYYEHRVHEGSGWLQNAAYNIRKGEEIKHLIRQFEHGNV